MPKNKNERRCAWSEGVGDFYIRYHDREWGVPIHSDRKHFEFLVLEGAQAGLSWATILKRREGYRRVFEGFDWKKVARFTPRRIERILKDPGIIRNRLKVESCVNNARAFEKVRQEFGTFDKYIWGFVGGKTLINRRRKMSDIPATTEESDRLSKDLKKRGFKFVGSTVMYAHMQAAGLVNDHEVACFRYRKCLR